MRAHYWTASFFHQWQPFFGGRWNWIDFTVIDVSIEWADYDAPHVLEIHLALLGFHVEIARVNRARLDALMGTVERLRSGSEG